MNLFNIENTYKQKVERGWDTVFWMVDMHNTIVPGLYDVTQEFRFYDDAKEVLQFLTQKEDVCLILYTCSHSSEICKMLNFFTDNAITFNHLNSNPDVPNTRLGDYSTKPYFNILLEDKCGCCGETDWHPIKELLEELYKEKI